MMLNHEKRPPFRFSLADLFVLTLLIAVVFAWEVWFGLGLRGAVWAEVWEWGWQIPATRCFLIGGWATVCRVDRRAALWLCLGILLAALGTIVGCFGSFGIIGCLRGFPHLFALPLPSLVWGALVPALCGILLARCVARNRNWAFVRANVWSLLPSLVVIVQLIVLTAWFATLASLDPHRDMWLRSR